MVQGKFQEALACFDKAIEINPYYSAALNNRALMLEVLGKLDESVISYNKSIEINPNNALVHYNRGIAL